MREFHQLACPRCAERDLWDLARGYCFRCEYGKPLTLLGRIRRWLGIEESASHIKALQCTCSSLGERIEALEAELRTFRDALRSKAKQSVFEPAGDKLPSTPKRYVPIARRRAQAEQASNGAHSHAEQVRANNARAIEGA